MNENTIVYCTENPLRTHLTDWLLSYLGRISVGHEINDDEVEILAYSDNQDDSATLHRLARDTNDIYIVSPYDGVANAID